MSKEVGLLKLFILKMERLQRLMESHWLKTVLIHKMGRCLLTGLFQKKHKTFLFKRWEDDQYEQTFRLVVIYRPYLLLKLFHTISLGPLETKIYLERNGMIFL